MDPELERAIAEIPLNRLLLETDAPYLRPLRHSISSPWIIMHSASILARLHRIPATVIAQMADVNARELYGLQ
jgi:TatD DNase family protein